MGSRHPRSVVVALGWALGVLTLAGGFAATAHAQDEPPPPLAPRGAKPPGPRAGEKLVDAASPDFRGAVLGDVSEGKDIAGERVVWAVGGVSQPVWIRFPDFELRCDSAVIWGDRARLQSSLDRRRDDPAAKDPGDLLGNVFHAIYAEGGVFVRRDKYTFHANRVLIDFQKNQAYLVDAAVQATTKSPTGREVALSVRAAVVRGIARDAFRAEDAKVSSCTYARPHVEFRTSWIEVDFSKKQPQYETGWWPTVRAETILSKEMPLLPIPKLGGSLGGRPIQAVEFSRSNRFGTTVGLGFGGEMERDDGSTWGTWLVTPRYRSDRGAGLGVEFEHDGPQNAAGRPSEHLEFDAEYQQDTANEDKFSERGFDGLEKGTTQADRGLARFFYTRRLGSEFETDTFGRGWRLVARADYVSDRGYLPEYHRDDATQGDPLETYVHLRRVWDDQGISLLASYRLQDEAVALVRLPSDLVNTNYAVQTDYLPSATWHLLNHPIFTPDDRRLPPINLSVEAGVANVERRFDEYTADELAKSNDWRSDKILREDLEARLTAPFEVGPVQVTPAVGGSLYHVSAANGFDNAGTPDADDGEGRSAAFVGLRAGTEASRTVTDTRSEAFDLRGLRHVASLDAQWFDRFHVSDTQSGDFQQNDLHDNLQEVNTVSLRLRNRLQTKREGESVDWIDYEARFLYYVSESDAVGGSMLGLREDFQAPLERIDSPAEEKYQGVRREGSAYHQHRARVQMRSNLWLEGEADYDMTLSQMDATSAGVRWFPERRFSIFVGRRTVHAGPGPDDDNTDGSDIWTLRADYTLSQKWGLTGEFQTDTKNNQSLSTVLGLYRRSHDFTIAMEFASDNLLDSTGVSFVLYPHDWIAQKNDPFSQRRPLDFEALRWYR